MAENLTEVQLQVLSAVRDEGVPTGDTEIIRRTGLEPAAIRQALRELGDDYLLIRPRGEDAGGEAIDVLDFKGDASVPRPPSRDWQE